MENNFITIARVSELPPTGRLEVTLNGRRIAIFKISSGIVATAAECPHRGGPLVAGWVENETVFCPLHGWEFDLRTGNCTNRPEKGIECYQLSIVGDEIRIRLN